jgi:O-antigen/teichoic acid export membrane protein
VTDHPGFAEREKGLLRPSVRSAVGWASLSTALSQGLLALVAFSVAAVVTPGQYALWGLGAILFNARILGTLGLEQALIFFSRRGRERDYLDTAFVATLVLGLALGLAGFIAAPVIAEQLKRGFSEGEVVLALRIMCVSLVFATLESIPSALLERRLAFRRRAVPDVGSTVFYAGLTLLLLLAGAGIWSLIIARAAYSVVRTIAFWVAAPVLPDLPPHAKLRTLRPMLGYGLLLNAAGLLSFLTQNVDTVSVARVAGATATGAYVLAFTVASFVPTFLAYSLMKVAFPLLVSAGAQAGRIHGALASVIHATAVVMFPTTAAIAFVAPPLLVRLFGDEWHVVEPLLTVLAFYGLFRALIEVLTAFLNATGRPAHPVLVQGAVLSVALALLWPLSAHGARGVALAFTIGQGAGMVLSLYLAREGWSTAFLFRLARPLTATVIATLGALAARSIVSSGAGPWIAAFAFVVLAAASTFALDPWARDAVRRAVRPSTAPEAAG